MRFRLWVTFRAASQAEAQSRTAGPRRVFCAARIFELSDAEFEELLSGLERLAQRQCCKFRSGTGVCRKASFDGDSGCHFKEFVDEPILTADVIPAQPPHLAFPNYAHRLVALNRSSRSLEFAKPLLGLHSPFDRTMILLDDVVQILDGSVATPAAERPFLLYVCDGGVVGRRQIRVDDARLRMR